MGCYEKFIMDTLLKPPAKAKRLQVVCQSDAMPVCQPVVIYAAILASLKVIEQYQPAW